MKNRMTENKLNRIKRRIEEAKEAWERAPLFLEFDFSWYVSKLIYEDVPTLFKEIDRLTKGERK